MTPPEKRNITVKLTSLISLALGNGYWHYRDIDRDTAEIIHAMLKNQSLAYIQWDHEETLEPLDRPILWDYEHWRSSTEAKTRVKNYCEKLRQSEAVMSKNVESVTAFIMEYAGLSFEVAKDKALKALKEGRIQQLRLMGWSGKLIERYEEL